MAMMMGMTECPEEIGERTRFRATADRKKRDCRH